MLHQPAQSAAISFITAFRTPDAVHCPDAVMQASD
jgi:hypothetical protein